ncbi:hypothetical protein MNBD_GAMMA22-179 [hydrothermal vent metagenome]|uniref:Uncharacterized protein n=1 Tax=hydrothermal vent metagenome TaxID=652676 RepID=A0A3B1BA04_9ZZZZ
MVNLRTIPNNRIFIGIIIMFTAINAHAIVSIGNLKFDEKNVGFNGSLNIDASGASGNSDKSSWHVGSNLVWRTKNYINLFLFGYDYGESNNQTNANKTFTHFRHIQQYTHTIDWELFAQLEKNEFTRLTRRELLGVGLRFSIEPNTLLGLGVFRFSERLDKTASSTDKLKDDGFRLNAYWNGEYTINPMSSFKARLYYQPKVDEFTDVRVLFNSDLKIKLYQNLSVKLSVDVTHDSRPPQGVKDTDFTYRSGVEYNF